MYKTITNNRYDYRPQPSPWKPAMSKGEVGNCCAGSFIQYFAIFLQSSPKSCDSQKKTGRFLNILQSSNILTRTSGAGKRSFLLEPS